MGYCAKVRIYSHIYCVIVALFIVISEQVYDVHGASAGSSWPSMKSYDIWGSDASSSLHTRRGSGDGSKLAASNDLQIQDYRDKTSFRNEKGMERTKKKTVLILYVCSLLLLPHSFFFNTYLYSSIGLFERKKKCLIVLSMLISCLIQNKWPDLFIIYFRNGFSLRVLILQCWTSLQRQVKTNANRKMAYGRVFAWTCMIAIRKAAPPKDSVHLALVPVVCVSSLFYSFLQQKKVVAILILFIERMKIINNDEAN